MFEYLNFTVFNRLRTTLKNLNLLVESGKGHDYTDNYDIATCNYVTINGK